MSAGLNKINSNKFVDPYAASQASPLQAAEYAAQADRTAYNISLPGGSAAFDITSGRLGSGFVRQTPTLGSGGPMQALLDADFAKVRDWNYSSSYLNALGGQPVEPYQLDYDSLVGAGSKYRGVSRDSIYNVEPKDTFDYVNKIDPIQKCAAGEQLMLLRASGAAGGITVNSSNIPEAYYNQNALARSSNLVGVAAADPAQMQYGDAYRTNIMASSAPPQQVAQPYSSLSMASFSRPGLYVP
jgi:hypothetical protein